MDSHSPAASSRRMSDTLRATAKLIWQQADGFARRQLALACLLLVAGSILSAIRPVIYKLVIDSFLTPLSSPTTAALIAAFVLVHYGAILAGGTRPLFHVQGVQRISRRISNRFFTHLMRLPLPFHLEQKSGAITETVSQGLQGCQIVLQHLVFTFLPLLIEVAAIVGVLVNLNESPYLAILAIASLAYGFTFWRAARRIVEPSRQLSRTHLEVQAALTDSLINCETVKYFHAETTVQSGYDLKLAARETAYRGLLRLKAVQSSVLESIYAVATCAAVGLAGYEVLHGAMTIGGFVLINAYLSRLVQPLESIGLAARDISQALAYVEQMLDVLDAAPEPDRTEQRMLETRTGGVVRFEKVTFSYGPDRNVLRDVSFEVPAGRTLGIVGASGSGKTSIIRLLFRLYEPDAGHIHLDGVRITELPLASLRSAIAIVPQDTVLFNDTIASNIAFGRADATRAEIEEAARLAHLHTFIAALPDGYNTRVGERGLKLSGGEKQRVAIARAILRKPRIFVFDEATSSLDSRTEAGILRSLFEVGRARSTIVIAHRLSSVMHAEEIIVLDHGSVIERGVHSSLMNRDGTYAALWQAQNAEAGSSYAMTSVLM